MTEEEKKLRRQLQITSNKAKELLVSMALFGGIAGYFYGASVSHSQVSSQNEEIGNSMSPITVTRNITTIIGNDTIRNQRTDTIAWELPTDVVEKYNLSR